MSYRIGSKFGNRDMTTNIELHKEYKDYMSELELRFDNDKLTVLKGMIDLYGNLKNTNFHDIADAIELWIDAYPEKELLFYIKNKNDCHYNSLVDIINSKYGV